MQAKSVFYAAVGAPVVAARKVTDQVTNLREKVSEESAGYTEAANKAIDGWATEGEKVISRISEGKVVEEISQKVDLDQAKEQVSKLRDQLEDMLVTWRASFRPEKEAAEDGKTDEKSGASKPAAKKPAAKKGAGAPKSGAKKTSAAKTTSAKGGKSSTAAKASSAKSQAAKAKAS